MSSFNVISDTNETEITTPNYSRAISTEISHSFSSLKFSKINLKYYYN